MVGDTTFQREAPFNTALLTKVTNLELSIRSSQCLKNNGVRCLGDLVRRSENEILSTPNFGRKSLDEIKDALREIGLHLGMEVPNWPPENLETLTDAYEDASTLDE